MKNILAVLLSALFIYLFISCSMPTDNYVDIPSTDFFDNMPASKTIIIGDSITERNKWMVASRGIGGYTVSATINNFPDINKYDHIIVLLGINDLGNGASVDKTVSEMKLLCDKIGAKNIYIVSVLPLEEERFSNITIEKIKELNREYDKLNTYYIDAFSSFIGLSESYLYTDGIHLTTDGYDILESSIYEHIDFSK